MGERLDVKQFSGAVEGDDWRVVYGGATAFFETGSFARGLALVQEIGALAEQANHHPDVDLRYPCVVVRTTSHDVGGLTERDVALASGISAAAARLGIEARPRRVQALQLAVDVMDVAAVLPFWTAVLGYDERDEVLRDPAAIGPRVWFQQMDEPREQRNRIHLDLAIGREEALARVEAAVAAGGHVVTDRYAPHWWTLADPEGNEVDVAPWVTDTVWEDDDE
ncbi:VOC family protein [Cellulomonas sp. HZM]|uniref:VOC family protein n=1 Tax=Cellulomonas sp. HZM TaxID=1454010 RepID=UPI00068EFE18|nr:VOC family protein [Cellulomonas sp. HZM]